jgi:hypothetical protein
MIGQTLSMLGAMYDAIGPGLLLAAGLPFFLTALLLILRAGLKRSSQ